MPTESARTSGLSSAVCCHQVAQFWALLFLLSPWLWLYELFCSLRLALSYHQHLFCFLPPSPCCLHLSPCFLAHLKTLNKQSPQHMSKCWIHSLRQGSAQRLYWFVKPAEVVLFVFGFRALLCSRFEGLIWLHLAFWSLYHFLWFKSFAVQQLLSLVHLMDWKTVQLDWRIR